MKKHILTLAVALCTLFATAQTNQYFYNKSNLMFGVGIAQTDSAIFGNIEGLDTLAIQLRNISYNLIYDTIYGTIHDTIVITDCDTNSQLLTNHPSLTKQIQQNDSGKGQQEIVEPINNDILYLFVPMKSVMTIHDTVYIYTHDTTYIYDCPKHKDGGIEGEFSISPSIKVRFAQGNLQYQASTHTWRFAENQWDIVGDSLIGDVYENGEKCNNYLISDTYSGWIDLFGWGTGNKPTQYKLDANYNTFVDWGMNTISNSTDNVIWRTPTANDLNYLLYGRNNASSLYGLCRINNHFGFVLLPDDWNAGVIQSSYSIEEWEDMEQQGAVFLPAGDSRIAQGLDKWSVGGYYWTSTTISDTYVATALRIWNKDYYSPHVDINNYDIRSYGRFVRLISEIEITDDCPSSFAKMENDTIFEGEMKEWQGRQLSETGLYSDSLKNMFGCDSILILNLVVEPEPIILPEGTLIGEFSVSPIKKVRFSQGNIQYQASTDTWRFAEKQWDMVGMGYGQTEENFSSCYIGGTVANSDNRQISATYTGWIDLFGWGTGNNPTNASTSNSDYSTFTDWGVNPISNGGNQANLWRTLTKDEWGYLFNTRANASSKYGVGMVNGVNGMILLPDEFTLPSGLSFTSGAYSDVGWQYYKEVNEYTTVEWSKMESAGAVFFPAAGDRRSSSINGVGSDGNYWSSTPNGKSYAYRWNFYSYGWIRYGDNRYYGLSVRLVQDIE